MLARTLAANPVPERGGLSAQLKTGKQGMKRMARSRRSLMKPAITNRKK